MTVGERVRTLREAQGLTQQALSDEVGVSRVMIAQIERGAKAPSLPLALELARALGCTLEELAGMAEKYA